MTILFTVLLSILPARAAVGAFIGVNNLSAAEPVCIVKSDVELHVAPNAKSKVSWLVGENMAFLKIKESRDKQWYQLRDIDNQTHWVRASAVSKTASCAVIKRSGAHLRTGPAETAAEAEYPVASRYTPFRKIDRDGEWVSLEDDYGYKYWANEKDLWIPAKRTGISF